MKKIFALILCAVFYGIGNCASIGAITELVGSGYINRNKVSIPLEKTVPIELNDTVTTKNGKARIVFNDKTTVLITENSSLLIDDFVYDPKTQNGRISAKSLEGTVRYTSGNIAHTNPAAAKLSTPTSTIAVRGTDFIMSVNEIGSTLVILMPNCETNVVAGSLCTVGEIEVKAGNSSALLNKAYQATLVETASTPPTIPIIVNLSNTGINNNLMISPPKTLSGISIIDAAKSAAEKTGDLKKQPVEQQSVSSTQQQAPQQDQGYTAVNNSKEIEIVVTTSNNNPNVHKIFKDKSETEQIGWQYESLSPSGSNYVNIIQPISSKTLVIVTQDRVSDAVNFNQLSNKYYGTIIINQSRE